MSLIREIFSCLSPLHSRRQLSTGAPCNILELEPMSKVNTNFSDRIVADLKHTDGDIRARAARTLGNIGAIEAVPELVSVLADESWIVRMNAAEALGLIGLSTEDAISGLEKLRQDPRPSVVAQATRALTRLRKDLINIGSKESAAESRYERGLRRLKLVEGHAGEHAVDSIKDTAPDLARFLVEFGFGDVYASDRLDIRSREIAAIAALTAMGNAQRQLKNRINSALNVGVSREEVVAVITQISVYAGFPAALNGIEAAKEVFAEREHSPTKLRKVAR